MTPGTARQKRRLILPGLAVLATAALLFPLSLHASLISRTIVIDGDMSDWLAPEDITNNEGQFSEDCEQGEDCELDDVQSTGRDLKKFAYTWDDDYLYFYVERFASTSNTTEWLFYLDSNANGLMEADEKIFRVDWQGSNRRTNAYLCDYFPDDPDGDPLVDPETGLGDGYSLPGDGGNCEDIYSNVVAGSDTGLEMESRLAWSEMGFPGPVNVRFHISSSRGMNLPNQIEDNMDGPGGDGGQLFPPDMSIDVEALDEQVWANQETTFLVTLTNEQFDPFSDIAIDITFPAALPYTADDAETGDFVDTTGDGVPDQWQVAFLDEQESLTLELTVTAQQVPAIMDLAVEALISDWEGTDTDADNNEDQAEITVNPIPELDVTKVSSTSTADPGQTVRYTLHVSNAAAGEAASVVLHDSMSPFLAFRLDTFGADEHFSFDDNGTGLTLGEPEFSDDDGVTFNYEPVSGAGGAPAGFDGNVTDWRIPMNGNMNGDDSSFQLRYDAAVH